MRVDVNRNPVGTDPYDPPREYRSASARGTRASISSPGLVRRGRSSPRRRRQQASCSCGADDGSLTRPVTKRARVACAVAPPHHRSPHGRSSSSKSSRESMSRTSWRSWNRLIASMRALGHVTPSSAIASPQRAHACLPCVRGRSAICTVHTGYSAGPTPTIYVAARRSADHGSWSGSGREELLWRGVSVSECPDDFVQAGHWRCALRHLVPQIALCGSGGIGSCWVLVR